jgi:hypothetical protein
MPDYYDSEQRVSIYKPQRSIGKRALLAAVEIFVFGCLLAVILAYCFFQ